MVSPPYDILSDGERRAFHESHPHNFLRVDLGAVLPGDAGPMTWHERSAALLSEWIKDGVLARRPRPALFFMRTEWNGPRPGERVDRLGFVCLMKLEEAGKKSRVRPHERTFSYHKEERLDLMKKTGAQLSPIFGFFPDPRGHFLEFLGDRTRGKPDASFTDPGGQLHEMTFVEDPADIAMVEKSLSDLTVYIADGHHRYATALNYRDLMTREAEKAGVAIPGESSLNYVMIYLCPMSDKGLLVLPTHRILSASPLSNGEILKKLGEFASVKLIPFGDGGRDRAMEVLKKKLREDKKKGLTVYGLVLNGADHHCFVKVREKVKETWAREHTDNSPLSRLDVSVLTGVILERALGMTEENLDDPDFMSYVSGVDEALGMVDSGKRAAFILNPVTLEEIVRVTESGRVMPRKATYFHPKVSGGLVVNLVDPAEIAR